jgi:pantoate kinase
MEAKAFSPGHITGFFTIEDSSPDINHKGSLGAGVSLTRGVMTTVNIKKSEEKRVSVYFNKTKTANAFVSGLVVDLFLQKAGISPLFDIIVEHDIFLPMGSGCGSSGAGALSLSYALNEAFKAGFSRVDCAQVAHQAEVRMKTGLGTVIGEVFGGIEVRVKPGAPGIGDIVHIPCPHSYKVIILMFGPLSTKEFLENKEMREKINYYGKALVKKIIKQPDISNFLLFSRGFAEKTGLVSREVAEVFSVCDVEGFVMSMPIFGNGVFTVVEQEKADKVCRILEKYKEKSELIVSDIDFKGTRVL